MRKTIYLFLTAILMALLLISCATERSALEDATGATHKQTKYIESRLAEHDISYETVLISNNPIVDGMDADWQAYDLIAEDGTSYVLILRKSDNDFTAVLDSDGRNIDGLIDNVVTPALFENGIYKFSKDN